MAYILINSMSKSVFNLLYLSNYNILTSGVMIIIMGQSLLISGVAANELSCVKVVVAHNKVMLTNMVKKYSL